jgi:hypothetical protein
VDTVVIVTLWDMRRNPLRLVEEFKKWGKYWGLSDQNSETVSEKEWSLSPLIFGTRDEKCGRSFGVFRKSCIFASRTKNEDNEETSYRNVKMYTAEYLLCKW